jgi:4-coumarate--CoA ligase
MHVVERVKELIKVRGFQVAPAELEGVLISHLVRKEGTNIQEAEVQAFMKEQLAGYKQLVGGVVFVDEIPKLPSGKILKRVLREMVKQEQEGSGGKLAAKL